MDFLILVAEHVQNMRTPLLADLEMDSIDHMKNLASGNHKIHLFTSLEHQLKQKFDNTVIFHVSI